MKKMIKNLMLVAVAAMGFTACNKEDFEEATNNSNAHDNIVEMTFIAGAPESRTSVTIDGNTATYSWSEDDKIGFYYVDTDFTNKKKQNSKAATIANDGTATFTASFELLDGATAYNLGAFYPGSSWVSHAESDYFNNVNVKISAAQNLTEGSFDPAADLLMSKPFMGVTLDSSNPMSLEFTRIAAIGKMNLKLTDMEAGEVINKVTFSLAEGTHFNGPVTLDLENSSYILGTTNTSNSVSLTGTLTANADRTAIFFTCFPGEYSGAYTIEVTTDKATYTKEGTLSKALTFTAGNVLNFNATVGNRYVEEVEDGTLVDVLTCATTGASGTNYIDWTATLNAKYAGNSAGDKNTIQLRSKNSNSGIVVTTSAGIVTKVEVEWNANTTSDRTLDVYGKNTAYSAATELYNSGTQGTKLGSIVCGKSTVLIIDGDYEYIGLRSNSGAMYLDNIKITWGAGDNRTAQTLSFPEASYTITEGDKFIAPTVEGAKTAVTYASSNESVATVDANSGAVTIKGTGTTTITATAAANDTYKAGKASYTLTVNAAQSGNEGNDKTIKYTFSSYEAGTQYAANEVHKLDEVLTITTTECHFTTQLRIYSSSSHDGYAIGSLSDGKTIKSLVLNAGNKVDTLNVYGSTDGSTWTLVKGVSITNTSYNDYTVDFGNTSYTYFKLDVAGTNQVRIASLTLTYAE